MALWRLDQRTGAVASVDGPWTGRRVRSFDVQSDGGHVLWIEAAAGEDAIWTAAIDGSGARRVTAPGDRWSARLALWTSQDRIAYQSNRGAQIDLWEISTTGSQPRRITTDPGIERPESAGTGGSLTYQLTTEEAALWIWNKDGRGTRISDEALADFAPSVSADGRRVAFQRSQPSPVEGFLEMDTDIFVADIPEPVGRISGERVATGWLPILSPDGRRLVYLQRTSEARGLAQLFAMDLDARTPRRVSPAVPLPAYGSFPSTWLEQYVAWRSPHEFLFIERANAPDTGQPRERSRIVQYRVGQGSTILPGTDVEGRIVDLHVSADGRTIAYLSWTTDRVTSPRLYLLHVLDLTSGRGRTLKTFPPRDWIHLRGWTRTGGLVLAEFAGTGDRALDVLVVDPDGAERQRDPIQTVEGVSKLDPRRDELYLTRQVNGASNLFAWSVAERRLRQVSDNSVIDETFGGAELLGADAVLGFRHRKMKDVYLLTPRR